nr:immunoglobulin heavy chain junction region [Macaca mulatta]MOV38322.1 immunoglobulin heavy chain junction region [Macaca mulatta]MOV38482.1 immunoglobulin heavy chain junction region [Macaca mulatta]MOV38724.1 immunoglobulin heavy chain junction region [Macaca mulatta]MOV38986.1 immunoglobulin heavy chain junction region [Macaca mulatta]
CARDLGGHGMNWADFDYW